MNFMWEIKHQEPGLPLVFYKSAVIRIKDRLWAHSTSTHAGGGLWPWPLLGWHRPGAGALSRPRSLRRPRPRAHPVPSTHCLSWNRARSGSVSTARGWSSSGPGIVARAASITTSRGRGTGRPGITHHPASARSAAGALAGARSRTITAARGGGSGGPRVAAAHTGIARHGGAAHRRRPSRLTVPA